MWLFERFKHHFVPGVHNGYRPKILYRQWLIFFFVVILATEGFLVSSLIARQSSQNFLAAVVPAEIITLTNSERASNKVAPLASDALLTKAAQAKADDMAANGYFAHTGPDGKTPWQWISGAGYQYQYAGENLAVRFIDSADVVNAWMASPTHRANIVKPVYTAIGVGVAQGMFEGQSATYVVQYFAAPLASGSSIEGASVATAPASLAANNFVSYVQSFVRQAVRAFAEPQLVSNTILALCASILIIALALTFFMHLQVQPTHMLVGGAFVAFFALFLLGINTRLTAGGGAPSSSDTSQSASAVEAATPAGVVINTEAADTGYALFPQL